MAEQKKEDENNIKEKFLKDIKYTTKNYSNMYNRLQQRDNWSKFLVIYYSVVGIINTILPKYFSISENYADVLDFSSVMVSIILLVTSVSISLAGYSGRAMKVMQGIDTLKHMKKEVQLLNAEDLCGKENDTYRKMLKMYREVVGTIELRTEYDYYLTCKEIEDEEKSQKVRETFRLSKRISVVLKHMGEIVLYWALLLFPVVFYIVLYIANRS